MAEIVCTVAPALPVLKPMEDPFSKPLFDTVPRPPNKVPAWLAVNSPVPPTLTIMAPPLPTVMYAGVQYAELPLYRADAFGNIRLPPLIIVGPV